MKKLSLVSGIIFSVIVFSYCSSSRKATVAAAPAVASYQASVAPILAANCAPCHFPDKGGNKRALDSYAGASVQVDEMLRRIQLNPGERGFMPQRHPKLSDSAINMIKQWKADGLAK